MEDNLRPERLEDIPDLLGILDITADGKHFRRELFLVIGQFQRQVVQFGLVDIQQQELFRIEPPDLTADFRTNRPASPGDQNPFAGNHLFDRLSVDGDELAAKQICIVQGTQVEFLLFFVTGKVEHTGGNQDRHPILFRAQGDLLHLFRRNAARDGDNDALGLGNRQGSFERIDSAIHLFIQDYLLMGLLIIIEKPDNMIRKVPLFRMAYQSPPALSSTVNQGIRLGMDIPEPVLFPAKAHQHTPDDDGKIVPATKVAVKTDGYLCPATEHQGNQTKARIYQRNPQRPFQQIKRTMADRDVVQATQLKNQFLCDNQPKGQHYHSGKGHPTFPKRKEHRPIIGKKQKQRIYATQKQPPFCSDMHSRKPSCMVIKQNSASLL